MDKNNLIRKGIVFGIMVLFVGVSFIQNISSDNKIVIFVDDNLAVSRNVTRMGIIPSSNIVNVGENFTATVYIDPTEAVGGWEIYLFSFSEEYATANEVTAGSEWAAFFDEGDIDNVNGTITEIMAWKMDNYPDYNHTACEISFTANNPGVCYVQLITVEVTDTLFQELDVITHNAIITITAINNPPYMPSDPDPEDGATSVDIDADLSWTGGDPDTGDTITYDIYFGTTSPPPMIVSNQSATSYDPRTLDYCTTYYWKIVAWDNHGASVSGPIWNFTTNCEPYTPSNPDPEDGATSVDIDADLSWTGGDPDTGDTITYDIYFGTTSPPPKVVSNQTGTTYDPGTMSYSTTYYWKIVAWDNHDAYTEGPIWEFTTELSDTELEIEITGGFGVHVVIRNVGDYDAIDVEWNVDITGGVLGGINWSDDGYVSILPPDGEMVLDIPLIIGLGRIEIAAAADASNAEAVSETKNGFIILFFVILQ